MQTTHLTDTFIAKLRGLKILNRTHIPDKERKDAEYAYLKQYLQDYIKSKQESSENDFAFNHPRYSVLVNSTLF
jgi:hypothetical protein